MENKEVNVIKNPANNWSHISGAGWSYLLRYQPQFADKCDWRKLDGYEWVQLLLMQPQFADKCDWSKLDGSDWSRLLVVRVEFADKCDWEKLDAVNWCVLVGRRPEFADKCDMSKFSGSDIVRLFRTRGRGRDVACLLRRVGECDFLTLTASDWCKVLSARPDFADKFEASTHDWTADEESAPVPEGVDSPYDDFREGE